MLICRSVIINQLGDLCLFRVYELDLLLSKCYEIVMTVSFIPFSNTFISFSIYLRLLIPKMYQLDLTKFRSKIKGFSAHKQLVHMRKVHNFQLGIDVYLLLNHTSTSGLLRKPELHYLFQEFYFFFPFSISRHLHSEKGSVGSGGGGNLRLEKCRNSPDREIRIGQEFSG